MDKIAKLTSPQILKQLKCLNHECYHVYIKIKISVANLRPCEPSQDSGAAEEFQVDIRATQH